MIGAFYDDYIHIHSACERLAHPGQRALINGLNCILGQDITASRLLSLFCIGLSVYFLKRLFDPSRSAFNTANLSSSLAIFFHPVILFPFFYTSQNSTSITGLWACVTAFYYIRLRPQLNQALGWTITVFLFSMSYFLRIEAVFFFLAVMGSWTLWNAVHENKNLWQARPSKEISLGLLAFSLIYVLLAQLLMPLLWQGAITPDMIVSKISPSTQASYPSETYWQIQLWAIVLYLRNWLDPFHFTFYGPWTDWWWLHQNAVLRWILSFIVLTVVSLLSWVSFSSRFSQSLRTTCAGLWLFFVATFILSFIPRTDWYYPARMYLGTLLAFCFWSAAYFSRSSVKKQRLAGLLVILSLAASLYQWRFHYSDLRTFLRFESQVYPESSPQALNGASQFLSREGELSKSLAYAFQAYQSIPVESLTLSLTASKYWQEALYQGFRVSLLLGDQDSARSAYKALQNIESFFSAAACLQNHEAPLSDCSKGERKMRFCYAWRNMTVNKQQDSQLFRLSPEEFCRR